LLATRAEQTTFLVVACYSYILPNEDCITRGYELNLTTALSLLLLLLLL